LKTHYELLDVDEGASFKEIKEKYLAKSKMYHPDVSSDTQNIYQDVQSAYKTLISPNTRKKYDLSLGIQTSLWEK
jgi:curved DNA-binding protein CbpA